MRTTSLVALMVGILSAVAMGQKLPREAVDAVEKRYAESKYAVTKEYTVNDVRVFALSVTTKEGKTEALITENGEFILNGFAGYDASKLPDPVQNLLDGMFERRPEEVQKYARSFYQVEVEIGRRTYRIMLDPVGRIRDMLSPAELKLEDVSKLDKADKKEIEAIKTRLPHYFENAEIKAAYQYPTVPGFFVVDIDNGRRQVRAVLNTERDIAWWRTTYEQSELPKPVVQTLSETFGKVKIRAVYRYQQVFYLLEQPVGRGGDTLDMRISPTGNVLQVRSDAADKEEQTATKKPARRPPG